MLKILNAVRAPERTLVFDWLFTIAAVWMVTGLYVDGWAHTHLGDELETFFTPWHAVLYSGAAALGGLVTVAAFLNYRKGHTFENILPREYKVALMGFIIFMAGGLFDMLWHQLFGIEENAEALYSPSHLILFVGGVTGVSTLWRAVWDREKNSSNYASALPHVISAALVLSVLSFIILPFHPYAHPMMGNSEHNPASGQLDLIVGIAGIMVFSALITGILLTLMRRVRLPFGSIALVLGINVFAMSYLQDHFEFIVPVITAGFLADILLYWSRGAFYKDWGMRAFAFILPALVFIFYVATVYNTEGIWWTFHLWSGSVVIAGLTGLVTSFLVAPPGISKN